MLMDCLSEVPMPFVSQCTEQLCYCCSKPIDESTWRGTLKIDGKEYTSLAGHLSTKSCEKVWNLTKSLQTSVEVMKLSRSKVRPKIWDSSKPSDDNIGLYFFPRGMRHDANLDQLINEVMENDLVLQAVIGEYEMLIFPSCILPKRYKTFQRKPYLWALFKRRENKFAVTAEPVNGAVHCAQGQANEKEHVSDQQDDVTDVEPNQEMFCMKSAVSFESQGLVNLHRHMEKQGSEGSARGGIGCSVKGESHAERTQQVSGSCVLGATNIGFQLKAHDERKQEDAREYGVHTQATAAATSSAVIAEATALATNDVNIPANHEQFNSNMGVQHDGKFCFVARETPRIREIIQELERENSLVFALQLKATSAESWQGSFATTM